MIISNQPNVQGRIFTLERKKQEIQEVFPTLILKLFINQIPL